MSQKDGGGWNAVSWRRVEFMYQLKKMKFETILNVTKEKRRKKRKKRRGKKSRRGKGKRRKEEIEGGREESQVLGHRSPGTVLGLASHPHGCRFLLNLVFAFPWEGPRLSWGTILLWSKDWERRFPKQKVGKEVHPRRTKWANSWGFMGSGNPAVGLGRTKCSGSK